MQDCHKALGETHLFLCKRVLDWEKGAPIEGQELGLENREGEMSRPQYGEVVYG